MRPVAADQVRWAVKRKGFRAAEHGRRDHEYFFLYNGEQKTNFWVKISRGARQVEAGEIRRNAASIGISANDLFLILSCEHDEARTRQVWASRGLR